MNIDFKKILKVGLFIAIPLLIGGLSALITMGNMQLFDSINKPPLAPPKWLFPVVWTILYIMMGIASYFLYKADSEEGREALVLYGIQLFFNFWWSIIFFNLKAYWFAAIWLFTMWIIILILLIKSYKIDKRAFWLLLPYFLWTTFAFYLNVGIAILN
jgi:tryptophan-rich sensory protein